MDNNNEAQHEPGGCISLEGLVLSRGSHPCDSPEMCAMEAVSAYCGCQVRNDHPDCASQVIGAFVRSINDSGGEYVRSRLVSRIPLLAVSKDKDWKHKIGRARLFADRAKLQAASVNDAAADAARAAAYAAYADAADYADYTARAAARVAYAAARAAGAAYAAQWDFALETLDLALAIKE